MDCMGSASTGMDKVTTCEEQSRLWPRVYQTWEWKGWKVNFRVEKPETMDWDQDRPTVLAIHAFGASVNHWRKNISEWSDAGYEVYAMDLLGFGASEKAVVPYSAELWRDQIVDFIEEMSHSPRQDWILVGNSIGSLLCLMAASFYRRTEALQHRIRSLVLINCAGGLFPVRYSELSPPLAVLLFVFKSILFNPVVGPWFFDSFRSKKNIEEVCRQVYVDQSQVTEELVNILHEPSCDPGASKVYLRVMTAPCGPKPRELLETIPGLPILLIWGDKDPWTPLAGGLHAGNSFPEIHQETELMVLPDTGHCPHDECPGVVNELVLSWLGRHRKVPEGP